jgi:hypothetical protein
MAVWCSYIARTCLRTSLKRVRSLSSTPREVLNERALSSLLQSVITSTLRLLYPTLPNTCEALVTQRAVFTHSKDLPEGIFEAGAEFAFILHERS